MIERAKPQTTFTLTTAAVVHKNKQQSKEKYQNIVIYVIMIHNSLRRNIVADSFSFIGICELERAAKKGE